MSQGEYVSNDLCMASRRLNHGARNAIVHRLFYDLHRTVSSRMEILRKLLIPEFDWLLK